MRVSNGIPFRWTQHWQRLESGARFLRMKLPFSERELRSFADQLIHRNQCTESLLRITLSRGAGVRGYSPKGADHPTVAMSLHATPDITAGHPPQWRLTVASPRLAAKEALAQYKTCNKLPQILARAEADANGADEAVLLNTDGFVVEGASSNLFWIEEAARAQHRVCTPRLL